ncbi:MAG: chemotaxis protein CheW [Proteobacteria bacterium]|nr:chemotaxis protein CheW [Pseudomonadota bacterium]MBU4296024.1 chemotaxis protein CheW [Pseudomonadota bacterium]MCG2747274.1 chemotaxis protein CheW [Desulfobulbaceae bacterium]
MAFIDDDETLQSFKDESHEHLDGIENDLLAIEEAGADIDLELVNKVFRAMHSIKGGAGFLGLNAVKTLAHAAENLLNKIRNKDLVPTTPVISGLLDAADLVNRLLNQPKGAVELDISGPLAALNSILSPESDQAAPPPGVSHANKPGTPGQPASWQGLLTEHSAEIADNRLGGFGIFVLEFERSSDGEQQGLSPTIQTTLESIGQVLGSQTDDSSAASPQPTYVLYATMMERDMLVSFAGLPPERVHEIQEQAEPAPASPVPTVEPSPIPAPVAEESPSPSPSKNVAADSAPQTKAGTDSSLRVNIKILDNLMTLAGELVLTRNQFLQIVHSSHQQIFDAVSQRFDLVTSELQEAIMCTRMQPVGNIFNKFKRVVRDLAHKLGKEIDLVLEGGEVEMDKTIIEALTDPLTHLVRNSVDHGIETPDKRTAAGKTPCGTLQIKAFHEGGQVIIEIVDDGGGIDTARIKEKVLSMGTHDKSQIEAMQEHELLRLIFLPGLSTAKEVTDVSGRGVGMDVVHANLSKVGGVFDIASKLGKGTTITIKLPLTLAIIPSLIVSVGTERYAIPQVNMVELVRVPASKVKQRIERIDEALVIRQRGRLLPLISLAEALGIEKRYYQVPKTKQVKVCQRQLIEDRRSCTAPSGEDSENLTSAGFGVTTGVSEVNQENRESPDRRTSPQSAVNIVVVSVGKFHYGLIVDKLLDSEEIVVKPLGSHLRQSQLYAGATIQGDGKVALILDVVGISKFMNLSSGSVRVRDRGPQETERINPDAQTLLLVRNSPKEQLAIPLNLVSRIEEIQRDQVELTGGRSNMQYRGSTLPLFSINEVAKVAPLQEDSSNLYVVVFPFGEREAGIMVSEIIDIVTVIGGLDDTTHKQPGIMGSVIIMKKITMLVDLFGIVAAMMPEWIRHTSLGTKSGQGQHILVVEDSPFFNRQICGFVSDAGYKVFSATDGVEGLALLEREKIDLILTDIEMPNMDGLEFTARVRTDARWSGMPIIAVTSLNSEAAEKRGLKAGVNEYMIKLDREKVIHTINSYLKH